MKRLLNTLKEKWPEYILEAIVIVASILGAIALENWNEERKERITEIKLLSELKQNLETNIDRFESHIVLDGKSIRSINMILEHMDGKRPYYDSLDSYFFQATIAYDIVLSSSAFESIKSIGFDIIESDSIRNNMINLFDETYASLISETVRLEDQFWPSSMLPMIHRHFRTYELGQKPVDYTKLLEDHIYTNTIANRKFFRITARNMNQEALAKSR